MDRLLTENKGAHVPAEQQYLHVTIAFAPYDIVLPAVAGLFRATNGHSRNDEASEETLWARFDRLEEERGDGDTIGPLDVVRVIEPSLTPWATIIEDHFEVDPAQLSKLLPEVTFLTLVSEYHSKKTERHIYTLRQNGSGIRRVYIHHNYQYPGWDWREKGPVQDWEDTDRLARKRISERCDRALMIDYADRLGCDLHGPLARGEYDRAMTIYKIEESDFREEPAPIEIGEEYRKRAVALRFGNGEEDVTFKGLLADNHYYACCGVYQDENLKAIWKTRSAKKLLEIMQNRGIAPDWQDPYCTDSLLWHHALRRAYQRFTNAPEVSELEKMALAQTRSHAYPVNELRLRNIYAQANGQPTEPDPEMMAGIMANGLDVLLGR